MAYPNHANLDNCKFLDPDNNVIDIYIGSWFMAFFTFTCLSALTKSSYSFYNIFYKWFYTYNGWFHLVLSAVRSWSPNWITETISSMSFLSHFTRIQMGVFDLNTLVFFVSMMILCLWINVQLVQLKKAD